MKPRDETRELKAAWSKREDDIMIYYPNKPDGHMLHDMINSKRLRSGFTDKEEKYGVSKTGILICAFTKINHL